MVWRSPEFLHIQVIAHLIEDTVAEFLALIQKKASWEAIVMEVVVIEALHHHHCIICYPFCMPGHSERSGLLLLVPSGHLDASWHLSVVSSPTRLTCIKSLGSEANDVAQGWLWVFVLIDLGLGAVEDASHHLCVHLRPPELFPKKTACPVSRPWCPASL